MVRTAKAAPYLGNVGESVFKTSCVVAVLRKLVSNHNLPLARRGSSIYQTLMPVREVLLFLRIRG